MFKLNTFLRDREDIGKLIYIKQCPREPVSKCGDGIEKLGHKWIIAQVRAGINAKAAVGSRERRNSFSRGINEAINRIMLNR